MKNDNNMIKDILIISDYDEGYGFSTYFNGTFNNKSINTICAYYWNDRHPDKGFKTMRAKLSEININPTYIIVCSDGAIYLENNY